MLKEAFVALGVAAAVVLSTPLVAAAAMPAATTCGGTLDTTYANSRLVSVSSPVVAPGGEVDVTFSPGYFVPGSTVTVSAASSKGSLPVISDGASSGAGTVDGYASAAGGVVVSVAVSKDASGRVDIAGVSDSACGGVTVSVISSTQLKTLALDGSLASTGGNLPTVLLVTGGAAVVFGAILIGARTRARRHLHE